MSLLLRPLLLAALCLTSCGEEEEPEVCSTEHVVDDVEGTPGVSGRSATQASSNR